MQSPSQIVEKASSKISGYHKHRIQTPWIYTYLDSAQESMKKEKRHTTLPPRASPLKCIRRLATAAPSDDTAFQSQRPKRQKTRLIYHALLLIERAPVREPRTHPIGNGLGQTCVELPVFCPDSQLYSTLSRSVACRHTFFQILGRIVQQDDVTLSAISGLVHHLDLETGQLIRRLFEHLRVSANIIG